MNSQNLYDQWLGTLTAKLVLLPDLPDETVETTLKSLWHAAAGHPCSAARACRTELEDLTSEQVALLEGMIEKRLSGIPLMQITGRAEFMGLELLFETSVCLVRPETEILGRLTLELLSRRPAGSSDLVMVDVGCGSGNLSCGIAHRLPQLRVHAIDVTTSCVDLTKRNVSHCGLADRIQVSHGNLFGPIEGLGLEQKVDIVISNPPYISTPRLSTDRANLAAHEPIEALDGGPYGFAIHQRLLKESPKFLRPGGWLAFEFGAGQWPQIQSLFARAKAYDEVTSAADATGVVRVGAVRKALA